MAVHKIRSLAKDTARCRGINCATKTSCARHKQIERDATSDYDPWGWVPVVEGLVVTDECTIRIEEET